MTDTELEALYGEAAAKAASDALAAIVAAWRERLPPPCSRPLCERDALLITYPDMVREEGTPPLRSLSAFCEHYLAGAFTTIHVLPFCRASSDEGFSVIDYREVDPSLGSWEDLEHLLSRFRLMVDLVLNHVSAKSAWFQAFLRDETPYRDYFITVPEGTDLSRVVRPRSLPLLTPFATAAGEKRVWTTFSADQIDLDYGNPAVLLEILDTLLFYVSHKIDFIRLDAVAYLWKRPGTSCIGLPETHRIIRVFRRVLEQAAPQVSLVTETNVPHEENIAYFGNGSDEARLVYNFALPPLVLHAFTSGDATKLSGWATGLSLPSPHVCFLNFLASHDGVGINPARGILSDGEIDMLVERTLRSGGLVSYKSNADGTESPYELNVSYLDALGGGADRFLTAHAIMLALAGVPAVYFHSLVGSPGWPQGVTAGGGKRAINRRRCDLPSLERELGVTGSRRWRIFTGMRRLLLARAAHAAFHPWSGQRVLDLDASVFAVLRGDPRAGGRVLCLQNVSGEPKSIRWNPREVLGHTPAEMTDIIEARSRAAFLHEPLRLEPYQTLWLKEGR